jgi:high-affinity K+ transport system ATPase subunit B
VGAILDILSEWYQGIDVYNKCKRKRPPEQLVVFGQTLLRGSLSCAFVAAVNSLVPLSVYAQERARVMTLISILYMLCLTTTLSFWWFPPFCSPC